MKLVSRIIRARKRKPEKNLPRMISRSCTGDEVRSTRVPVWRSSATSRMEMKMLATMVRPLV